MALKLSAEFQGQHIQHLKTIHPSIETLILLVDDTQVEFPVNVYEHFSSAPIDIKVLSTGAFQAVNQLFPTAQIDYINLEKTTDLNDIFHDLRTLILKNHTKTNISHQNTVSSAFVSHAVKDEPLIMPVIQYLKTYYKIPMFSCHDSIRGGNNWHSEIIKGIKQSEQVIVMVSKAMGASTFCAFEVGYALALDKPLQLISLDGCAPPTYIQHLHMQNLPRNNRLKPWLTLKEMLIETLLNIVF